MILLSRKRLATDGFEVTLMALRILWDEKETAILVDYYMQFRDGKLSRAEAIANASIELRNRAIQSGIEIDDIFRNENGIAMQMNKIEDLFLGREGRLSKAPQVFVDIVNKYHNDRKSYNEIISKARCVRNDNDSIEEDFFIWLTGKVPSAQMSELYFVYQDIESFCFSRKILKQSLFQTDDVDIIATVKNHIDSNEIFRYAYKKKARLMQSAIKYYYDFIKEYKVEKKLGIVNGSKSDEQKCDNVYGRLQAELQSEIEEVSMGPEEDDLLILFLKKHDVSFIDNRDKGGCLWIRGNHELDNLVKYCRCNLSVNFHYKEEGARTLNYEVGWWTRDYAKANTSVHISRSSLQKQVPQSLDSELFQKWMIENKGIALTTSKSYASGINNCEQLAIRLSLSSQRIYGVSLTEAKRTIGLLTQTEEYQKANKSQHNRLRASLIKYLQYLTGDIEVMLENQKDKHYREDTVELSVQEMNEDLTLYSQILYDKFPKGYRIDSNLDLKRFISYYNTTYGTSIESDNDFMREKIRKCILSVGIQHGDRIFSVDSLISMETKKHLLDYVEHCFSQGIPILYYSAIFEEFNEEFLGQKIYNDDMLRTFLMNECKQKYIFDKNYM